MQTSSGAYITPILEAFWLGHVQVASHALWVCHSLVQQLRGVELLITSGLKAPELLHHLLHLFLPSIQPAQHGLTVLVGHMLGGIATAGGRVAGPLHASNAAASTVAAVGDGGLLQAGAV